MLLAHQTIEKRIWSLPISISAGNVKLWLDPDYEEGITLVNNKFSEVKDRSSRVLHFTNSDPNQRPNKQLIRGRNFIKCDIGSTNFLAAAGTNDDFNFLHNGSDRTVVIVWGTILNAGGATSQKLMGNTQGTTTQVGWGVNHIDSTDNVQALCVRGASGTTLYNRQVSFPAAQVNLYIETYENSTKKHGISINNGAFSYVTTTQIPSAANAFSDMALGISTGTLPEGYHIGDVLVCDNLFTSGQITDTVNYLTEKYNTFPIV